MSWLSPVQWAKWTWTAVRGGGEEEGETDSRMDDELLTEEVQEALKRDQEEDERSHGCSSDSEGQFETPEAETPVHQPLKEPTALDHPVTESIGYSEDGVNQLTSIITQNLTLTETFPEDAPAPVQWQTSVDPILTLKPRNQTSSADMDMDQPDPVEAGLTVDPEPTCNGHIEEPSPKSQTKSLKPRPPSLKVKTPLNGVDPNEVDDNPPILPKGSYNFDTVQFDDSINPFTTGHSKLQNSPPANVSIPKSELTDETFAQPIKLEFGLDDGKSKKPPPKKLGRKTSSKLAPPKTQRPKAAESAASLPETSSEQDKPPSQDVAPMNVDDIPIPKKSYNFDPNQWDDPNFNPFGGNSKPSNSPTLPKGSYTFDPDNFDDSVEPFMPPKTLGGGDTIKPMTEKLTDKYKPEETLEQRKKAGQSPKKNKDRTITNSCKVKKYDNQSLVLDVCSQEKDVQEDPASELPHRVQHATDEEKLVMGQKDGVDEFSDCTKTCTKTADDLPVGIKRQFDERDLTSPSTEELCESPALSSSDSETVEKLSPGLDSISLSEIDKAAVLTLIREEIISKEIEANEWKRQYEESRLEVIEMRKIVDEYEKTVAQMIEDEQCKNIGSEKSVHQLTLERDQALADLNSVERSLSDLFRRYENMKTVLEGFKKNEEVLKKCAQDYLARVRQEEQRYQTLKIHAEEKLERANEEIAQVRAKANAESVALNASLRKEQMKVESMERALEQKNQEFEELSKICDELIAKLGTAD
ncbi:transforming acidic coiled-coil-containing protein 1-like isoform X2 [Myxocyprinus asiaticus]|uniref:transforming acidic coiled-coil-containing protein 1-like isoform X2 n=1 Tax=Myxocyprinus asiaticus TaxID=70543 RepID=UPI002222A591|nr:transforming acidic coiled-coil-containing protein 1-like isoform X2 [Myxocyprinus asiaticus]